MSKLTDAKKILTALNSPRTNDISALTLLALCGIGPRDSWQNTKATSLTVTKGIMEFVAKQYKRPYAPNTRETFRRQVLHHFESIGLVLRNPDAPDLPTNSALTHYRLTDEAAETIRKYGTPGWNVALKKFNALHILPDVRTWPNALGISLPDGQTITLSPGAHNELQVAVLRDFVPRFAPATEVLYIGDTANKALVFNTDRLAALGLSLSDHGKLPDLILLDGNRGWLFLIEVVTSHGPMSELRVNQLSKLFKASSLPCVYVTAFPDRLEFRKHVKDVAWETEVWIADNPDHMIHFNGEKFLGPYST